MHRVITNSLEDYIRFGDETTAELLREKSQLVQAVQDVYSFFQNELWTDTSGAKPLPMTLAVHAFNTFLCGVRVAFTGHAAAIFPLMRTALESACYSYLITEDDSLADVWMKRNESEEHWKLCRRRFTPAVSETAKSINAIYATRGDWIQEAYDRAIDFGAHPNPRGIFNHVSFSDDLPTGLTRMSVAALHNPHSIESLRSLVACIEYGEAIAFILAHCLPNVSEKLLLRIVEFGAIKDAAIESEIAAGRLGAPSNGR